MNELPANYKVYKNGAVYDTDKGRIVAMRPELATKNTQITGENTAEYRRKRQEKQQEALRARILDVTRKHSDANLNDSAEAVAEAGAFLWDEIVLGQDIYPRDRLDAWERLGKHAGILVDKKDNDAPTAAEQMSDLLTALASFAASIAPPSSFDIMSISSTGDAVDGTVIDSADSGQEAAEWKDDGG